MSSGTWDAPRHVPSFDRLSRRSGDRTHEIPVDEFPTWGIAEVGEGISALHHEFRLGTPVPDGCPLLWEQVTIHGEHIVYTRVKFRAEMLDHERRLMKPAGNLTFSSLKQRIYSLQEQGRL